MTTTTDHATVTPDSMPRNRRILGAVLATHLAAALAATPAASGTLPAGPSALVIHGGDRTLAAVASPAGPAQLGLTALGTFPNKIVVRGTKAYVVCSGSDEVQVVDLLSGSVVQTIPTGGGSNPYGIAFLDESRVYVSRLARNDVVAIDLPAGTIAATIPVGRSPEGVAVAAGRVFVANSGFDFSTFGYDPGSVSVIDAGTNSVATTLPVGLNPQALALAPNGELHVACTGDYFSVFGRGFVIDPVAATVVDSVEVGASPGTIAVSPTGAAYLGDYFAGLLKYDTATRTVLRDGLNPISVGTGAGGIDFGGGLTWVCLYDDDQLLALDASDTVVEAFPMGDGPQDVVFYTPTPPVPLRLVSAAAVFAAGRARLEWITTGDVHAVAFKVDRAGDSAGPWSRRTSTPVSAHGPGRYTWNETLDAETGARLWYRLSAVDRNGRTETLALLALTPEPTSPGIRVAPPTPNPLRSGAATVAFRTGQDGPVRVMIFDAAGRPVRDLHAGPLAAGPHEFQWDGRSDDGQAVSRGLYFVRVAGVEGTMTRRLAVLGR